MATYAVTYLFSGCSEEDAARLASDGEDAFGAQAVSDQIAITLVGAGVVKVAEGNLS